MENLDNDILENILYRLPLGSVSSEARRVCESWKTILVNRPHKEVGFLFACSDPENKKIQLCFGKEYDYIDGNKMKYSDETLMEMEHCRFSYKSYQRDILVGSCNGLVCFQKVHPGEEVHESFAICNPLTGEFIYLKPNFSRAWNDEPKIVANGFGYCQATKEYKVVRLYTLNFKRSQVQVYTIGSNQWRDMEISVSHRFGKSGIFANGVLHWLGDNKYGVRNISVFDLEDEKFHELLLPPSEVLEPENSSYSAFDYELKLLGESLCLVRVSRPCGHMYIWAYKRNNHIKEEYHPKSDYYCENSWNWVKEFSIECRRYYVPFAITKANEVLLLCASRLSTVMIIKLEI